MTAVTRRVTYRTPHLYKAGCGYPIAVPGICAECNEAALKAERIEDTRNKVLNFASGKVICDQGRHWIQPRTRCGECEQEKMERVEETRKRVLEQAASRMEDVPCERRRHWIRRGGECGEAIIKRRGRGGVERKRQETKFLVLRLGGSA